VTHSLSFLPYFLLVDEGLDMEMMTIFAGMWLHVMTFEEGNVLEDQKWQAPSSCFERTPASLIASKVDDQTRQGLFSKESLGDHKELFDNERITS